MPEQCELPLRAVTWAAMQVIDASFKLSGTEKRLLFKIYGFARGGSGCFASLDTLATRLGLSRSAVKKARTRLHRLGLLTMERRVKPPNTWRIVVTEDLIPEDAARLVEDDLVRYRERLDAYLDFRHRRMTEAPHQKTEAPQRVPPKAPQRVPPEAPQRVPAIGGRREGVGEGEATKSWLVTSSPSELPRRRNRDGEVGPTPIQHLLP